MKLYKGNLMYIGRATGKQLFTRAVDLKDAERIMMNNLDTRTDTVADIQEADISEMNMKSIPIGFIHPLAK